MFCNKSKQSEFLCYLQRGHMGGCKKRRGATAITVDAVEAVQHPAHYGGDTPHEVIKCLQAWGLESDALLWNAVKYIARAGKKNPARLVEDLEKAQFYLARKIDELKRGSNAGNK